MLDEKIREFLHNIELCEVCISRYINKSNFNLCTSSAESTEDENPKKKRSNICIACLGIFQEIDSVADEIINSSSLSSYDSKSLYTSISTPITLLIRELSIWVALIQQFPGKVDRCKLVNSNMRIYPSDF